MSEGENFTPESTAFTSPEVSRVFRAATRMRLNTLLFDMLGRSGGGNFSDLRQELISIREAKKPGEIIYASTLTNLLNEMRDAKLVNKAGSRYELTDTGRAVYGMFTQVASRIASELTPDSK